MKVEVELSEIEDLRFKLERAEEDADKLRGKLSELCEPELKQKALDLSLRLLDSYLSAIFTELGFQETQRSVVFNDRLDQWYGIHRWTEGKIKVDLHVDIVNDFKNAFLRIGVKPEKQEPKEDKFKL